MKNFKVLISNLFFLIPLLSFSQPFETNVNDYLSANSEISNIGLTVNIKSSEIVEIVKNEIQNPIANGESPELGFMLHANESVTVQELTNMMTSPAKDAYDEIERIPKVTIRSIKTGARSFGCFITPWKWGRCWKDVYEDIKEITMDEVTHHFDRVEAVYKDVLVPIIKINQTIFPIKGKFNYDVSLDDLDITFNGNKYTTVGVFKINVRTNVFLDNLPNTITPKGNFNSGFKIKIIQSGYFEIKPDGAINVSEPKTELSFLEAFDSNFIIDSIDLGSKSNPVSFYLLDLIGNKIDDKLNGIVKSTIGKNTSKINIKDYSTKLLKEFDKPIVINNNGLVYPNVTGVFVSQPYGKQINNENQLELKFGVKFQPFATFETIPIPLKDKDSIIKFGTEIVDGDGISLSLPVFLKYDYISTQLKPFTLDFNSKNEKNFLIKKYILNNPTAKYSEQENVKLSVDILKRKNNKKIGTIDIDARFFATEQDTSICVKVSNLKIKSSNILILLAKSKIKKALIKEAEKNSCKNLSKEIINASKELNESLTIKTSMGVIKGSTNSLSLADILAFPDFVLMRVNLKGTLLFENLK
ncbi:DUF4403 family protein [Flavobacterium sp. ZT3R18]|uniref:DUF4403 family protein n=1 Tax=Flavobacterium sp. ZT3R18 TaxID=2594429 RepID=UPI00117A9378|nr:DUF4403 family protein [Flavobacterium sp. ZT3R18]TRX31201.1 DUF4403 family protein [Flavobacterium sp. ZT3R18]